MNEIFLVCLDDFRFRVVDGARLERIELAVHQDFLTLPEVFSHEREVPPAAVEPRRAVVENELEECFSATAPALYAERDNFAARGGRFVQLQVSDGTEAAAVFITSWTMQQQIADGVNSQPRQLRGAFGADASPRFQRNVERTRGCGLWWRPGHATFIESNVRTPKSKVVRRRAAWLGVS